MEPRKYDVRLSETQVRQLDDLICDEIEFLGTCDESDDHIELWERVRDALRVIPCPKCNPVSEM